VLLSPMPATNEDFDLNRINTKAFQKSSRHALVLSWNVKEDEDQQLRRASTRMRRSKIQELQSRLCNYSF
jgi:hypothetical protein